MRASLILAFVSTFAVARAAEAPDVRLPAPAEPARSRWNFQFTPKAFQKHPELDFHVITELTPEGRKAPQPTAQHPIFYLAQPGKFMQLGDNVADEKAPNLAALESAIQSALAASNFEVATPRTPVPTLVVVFNYGSFAQSSTTQNDLNEADTLQSAAEDGTAPVMRAAGERDVESMLPVVLASPQARTDLIHRAELVGGEKFAHDLGAVLDQEAKLKQAGGGLFGPLRDVTPFHRFMNSSTEITDLVVDAFGSCYFVTASAYDYAAMRHGKRVLLWRTKMTVSSQGVSMTESLPSLIAAAGPYLGRETPSAVTLTRKLNREGRVELGTPRVVEDPPPASASGH